MRRERRLILEQLVEHELLRIGCAAMHQEQFHPRFGARRLAQPRENRGDRIGLARLRLPDRRDCDAASVLLCLHGVLLSSMMTRRTLALVRRVMFRPTPNRPHASAPVWTARHCQPSGIAAGGRPQGTHLPAPSANAAGWSD